jgi:hypothetical protein
MQTMRHHRLLGLLLLAAAPVAGADVLLIDTVEMSAQTSSTRPARGMTMSRVEANFGTPTNRRGAIGDPPISRWEYPDFTVYFEHDHVIHAVARR